MIFRYFYFMKEIILNSYINLRGVNLLMLILLYLNLFIQIKITCI